MRSAERRRPWSEACGRPEPQVVASACKIYDIFEGTEQIQQLVIARAISGRHIA